MSKSRQNKQASTRTVIIDCLFQLGEEEENTPAVLYISSTTTLRPTTTTTPPPRRVLLTSDSLTNPADPIFEGCNSTKATKACFGYPDGCVEDGRCEMIVTYEPAGDLGYLFHMKVTRYWHSPRPPTLR